MKARIFFLSIILFSTIPSQREEYYKEQYKSFFDHSGSVYEDASTSLKILSEKDFAPIWTVQEFSYWADEPLFTFGDPLGYIGANFQRFHIHYLDVHKSKHNPAVYEVKGKTKVKENICDFTGTFTIEHLQVGEGGNAEWLSNGENNLGWEDMSDWEKRPHKYGTIVGYYELKENPLQQHAGILRGMFTSHFVINEEGNIAYDLSDLYSDSFKNNQFEGTWTPYGSEVAKVCNWGDCRIPNSRGLDMGAGCFSPWDEFVSNGWQTYRDHYFAKDESVRQEARRKEYEAWWE